MACHLLGDDLGLLSRRRDHYLGTPAPEFLTEGQYIDWLDQLQIEWVRAARRLSPRLVVELLDWTGPRVAEVLSNEDLTVRSARVSWAGPEPVPVWLHQLRELSEYWIHRQQLLDALYRPADLDPLLLRPILHGLRWAYPYRLSQAGLPPGGAIRIRIGEPLDETWLLVLHGGTWEFSDGPEDKVMATASFSADQAWRLLTNNLAQPAGDLDMHGDEHAVQIIATTRAIIGHPKS